MLITLDFESDKPIYTQLYEEIILASASGELSEGSTLPAVRTLAEEVGINLHTVNKAYNLLKDEGYLSIDRRHGAKINPRPITPKDKQLEEIASSLKLLCAKAFLLGQSEEDILRQCQAYFNSFKEDLK
jgi:GntR family transcriptional regulator